MNQTQIDAAADYFIKRRKDSNINHRLAADLRPVTTEDALAIQKATMQLIGDNVGGWKTVLPVGDKLNVAPIFARTIHTQSPCPIRLERGICRIEPEIGFSFKHDLPPRDQAYTDDEIKNALASSHMALELIEKRYNGIEEVTYLENLADCLFNQGMYVGPEIPLDKAMVAAEIGFGLTQGETSKPFVGSHPNKGPILPVLWLANFLREQGIGIKAGQVVITGSFAGVHEVQPDIEFSLEYGDLGQMRVCLTPSV